MALIQCHECKREISSTAAACPHCGAKPKAVTIANGLSSIGCLLTMFITVPIVILLAFGVCAK